MNSRFVSIWVCVALAIGLDVAIQDSQLGFLAYLAVIAGAIICTFGHFLTALPASFKNQTVRFEKKLFVFSANLMGMLAAFKLLQPEYLAWYHSTEEITLTARLTAAGLLCALSICALFLVDCAVDAIESVVVGDTPELNLLVSVAAGAFGSLMLLNTNVAHYPSLTHILPFAALAWTALCVYTGMVAQNAKVHRSRVLSTTLLMFGAILLFAHPMRALIGDHLEVFPLMNFDDSIDFLVTVVCWSVFSAVAATCIGVRQLSLGESIGLH